MPLECQGIGNCVSASVKPQDILDVKLPDFRDRIFRGRKIQISIYSEPVRRYQEPHRRSHSRHVALQPASRIVDGARRRLHLDNQRDLRRFRTCHDDVGFKNHDLKLPLSPQLRPADLVRDGQTETWPGLLPVSRHAAQRERSVISLEVRRSFSIPLPLRLRTDTESA